MVGQDSSAGATDRTAHSLAHPRALHHGSKQSIHSQPLFCLDVKSNRGQVLCLSTAVDELCPNRWRNGTVQDWWNLSVE